MGINVLSLFDGMSCGQIALDRLGIKVDNYYASEVDKYAIQITQDNYPNTIQLGDVRDIKGSVPDYYLDILEELFGVDLIESRSKLQYKINRRKVIKTKFNGNIIKDIYPGIRGRDLGRAIDGFKSSFSDWETYAYYSKPEKILKEFNNYIGKYV